MKPHKYHAKPTIVDGIRFARTAEARRYGELKLLAKAGEIIGLKLQPEFSLNAWSADHSECPKVGVYRADFEYEEKVDVGETDVVGTYYTESGPRHYSSAATLPGRVVCWRRVVEDVKGFKTPLYRWKKKHVEAQYGITVTEVS